MRRLAAGLALGLGVLALTAADEPPLPEVATALERIKDASTIELTTVGRASGKPHTRPIWFVVSEGRILVQAGKSGKTDWYRNLRKNPAVVVHQDGYTLRSRAAVVNDAAQIERIHRLFLAKYTSAWLLSFVGSSIGRGIPVELVPESVSVR